MTAIKYTGEILMRENLNVDVHPDKDGLTAFISDPVSGEELEVGTWSDGDRAIDAGHLILKSSRTGSRRWVDDLGDIYEMSTHIRLTVFEGAKPLV